MKYTSYIFRAMAFIVFLSTLSTIARVEAPQSREITDIAAQVKKEKLNGIIFEYRLDIDNVTGARHELLKLNGKRVGKEEYEDAYRTAKKAYKNNKKEYEEYMRSEEQERVRHIAAIGSLRLLELAAAEVEHILKKLDDQSLKPFYQFANHSIKSQEELDVLHDEWLPQARKLLRAAEKPDINVVNTLLVSVEPVPKRLKDFFHASLEKGISQADDPKILKKWLSVIA